MGTRSTIKFYDNHSETQIPVLSLYNQYDGYPSGVGVSLAKWLKNKSVINGFGMETMEDGYSNGMSCLALQFVKENKKRIGNLYATFNKDRQEYNYKVKYNKTDDVFVIEICESDNEEPIFKGTPGELIEKYDEGVGYVWDHPNLVYLNL